MSILIVLGSLIRAIARNFAGISLAERGELLGVGSFLLVHAAAEGWILAVGSPFLFFFWLTCSRAMDLCTKEEGQERRIAEDFAEGDGRKPYRRKRSRRIRRRRGRTLSLENAE